MLPWRLQQPICSPRAGRRTRPDWQAVGEILADAYRQVAPKFLVARLD
jgi:hypothetical protein